MKKNSKKYKPKQICLNNMNRVLFGCMPLSSQHEIMNNVKICQTRAFNKLRAGTAQAHEINELIDLVNMSECFSNNGAGVEYRYVIQSARDAIVSITNRAATTNRFTPSGDELNAFMSIFELYDAQLEIITIAQAEGITSQVIAAHKNNSCGIRLSTFNGYAH